MAVLILMAAQLCCAEAVSGSGADKGSGGQETGIGFADGGGPPCGNGILDEGEDCESPFDACCDSTTCTYKAAGTECRSATDPCDATEVCTGSSKSCPVDGSRPDGEGCPGRGTCQDGICTSGGGQVNPRTGDVLYMPFNDGTATDISGNDHHGTEYGAVPAAGKYSQGFSFDGDDDYIEIEDSPSLFVGNTLTIEAWLRRTSNSYTSYIYSDTKESDTPSTEITVAVETDGRIGIKSNSGCTNKYEQVFSAMSAVLSLDTWTHLAVTWDGSNVRFYLDGALQDTQPFAYTPCEKPSTSFRLGQRHGPGNAYGGYMDELKVSRYVKSEAEIQQSMGYDSTEPECGNGVLETGEACDDSNTQSCDGCTADCSATESKQTYYVDSDNDGDGDPDKTVEAYCTGTGRSTSNDDCDDANAAVHSGATEICGDGLDNDCFDGDAPCTAGCGNGTLESGEDCESPFDVCCDSASCRYASPAIQCRAPSGQCDAVEMCTGSSAACPPDDVAPDGTSCSGGTCQGGACVKSGPVCGDGTVESGEECEAPFDLCCDPGSCTYKAQGTPCRQAAGQCDETEVCTGSSDGCPTDAFASNSTPCAGGTCLDGVCPDAGCSTTSPTASGSVSGGSGFFSGLCQIVGNGSKLEIYSMVCVSNSCTCNFAGDIALSEVTASGSVSGGTGLLFSGLCQIVGNGNKLEIGGMVCDSVACSCGHVGDITLSGATASGSVSGGGGFYNGLCQIAGNGSKLEIYSLVCDTIACSCNFAGDISLSGVQTCTAACGNGSLEPGEACEAPFDPCCDSASCQFRGPTTQCRAAAGQCDQAESCTGSSAECPSNGFAPDGTHCSDGTCQGGRCLPP